MRFVSFLVPGEIEVIPYLGILDGDTIEDFGIEAGDILFRLLGEGRTDVEGLRWYMEQYAVQRQLADVRLRAPVPYPTGLRIFLAFESHAKAVYESVGRAIPEAWYAAPAFYFGNQAAVFGPDDVIPYPRRSQALDYGLAVACVIASGGQNIPVEKAEDHIMGYMIFNDWTARDLQQQEMVLGLGSVKSADFANAFGPHLVTPDELKDCRTDRPGVYDLAMVARVNGQERSHGNWKDIHYSVAEMFARASEEVKLRPGDILESGAMGAGCLLELTQGKGPWLQPGDVVELEIERLGVLRNIVR